MSPPFYAAAITGMGLACRRFDREIAPGQPIPSARFIYADDAAVHAPDVRSVKLALSAAISAFGSQISNARDGGLETCAAETGTAIVISKGLIESLEDAVERADKSSAPMIFDCAPDAAARLIARTLNLGGPRAAAVAACASGLASIKLGLNWLRDGICRTVLAGAAESTRSEMVLRSFERLGVVSPTGATRPFDINRDGFVVGEGAAVFRLEPLDAAHHNEKIGRGPRVLGELRGIALGSDAHHLTTPDPGGAALAEVLAQAIAGSGLEPAQIGWIHAHGTATAYNDRVEVAALQRVFGKHIPPLTATKGATGHLLGASGAIALAITLEALRGGIIPYIVGLESPAPEFEELDLVRNKPRHSKARAALVLNHGFGGHLAAAVVSLPER